MQVYVGQVLHVEFEPFLREYFCAFDIPSMCGLMCQHCEPQSECISALSALLDVAFSSCLQLWKSYSAHLQIILRRSCSRCSYSLSVCGRR